MEHLENAQDFHLQDPSRTGDAYHRDADADRYGHRNFRMSPGTRHRAFYARPREAPGPSAGGLQVARRQVTLKPPTTGMTRKHKRPPPADGGLDHFGGAGCYSAAIRSACATRSMM